MTYNKTATVLNCLISDHSERQSFCHKKKQAQIYDKIAR